MWVGFSFLGTYDVIESIIIYLYQRLKGNPKNDINIDSVSASIPPIKVYDPRINYDEDYRRQMTRKMWRRKAKVAAIIERWTKSPNIKQQLNGK